MAQLLRTAILASLLTDIVYTECPTGCKSCVEVECLSCDTSYYLSKNSCLKCPENCLSCVDQSNCTTCKAHKWGIGDFQYFSDCNKECLNNECYDDTGYCLACVHGKFGQRCQHNCDICKSGICALNKCTDGCKNGFYESQTDDDYICYKCSKNCTECVDANLCRKCNDGFYLNKFYFNGNAFVRCVACTSENECSNYCHIQECNQCQILNNELICKTCREGEIFNGVSCVQNTTLCSKECSTNCDSNGMCLGSCTDGWSGDKCSEECNEKCFICSKDDKDICLRCKGDFYFADCSASCNLSCIKEQGNQTCSTDNGFCLNGCKQGFWDKYCNQSCSDKCINRICDRNNGNCIGMCKDGNKEGTCVQTTIKEVITKGSTESSSPKKSTKEEKQKNESNDVIIIGAAAGVGVLVLILVFVVCICLRKGRRKSTDHVTVQNDVVVIEDQNDLYAKPMKKSKVAQETQDYLYAQPDKSHKQKKPSKKEISKPKNMYDNIAIDLEDEKEISDNAYATIAIDRDTDRGTEETDVDEINLEELDDGSSKLIETDVKAPSVDLYYNTACLTRSRIQLSDFLEYSKKKTDYESEFEKLPKGLTRTCDVALMRNNRI